MKREFECAYTAAKPDAKVVKAGDCGEKENNCEAGEEVLTGGFLVAVGEGYCGEDCSGKKEHQGEVGALLGDGLLGDGKVPSPVRADGFLAAISVGEEQLGQGMGGM